MSITFTYALLINRYWRLILRLVCTSIPHLSSGGTGKRWLGVVWYALVSGCSEH